MPTQSSLLKFLLTGFLLAQVLTIAHARRWQNLHVGYREFQVGSGSGGVTVVYSVTADIVAGGVVFDLDIDRRGIQVSRSVADVRIPKAELPQFEAVLKTFDQWRDKSRETPTPAFEKPIARVAGIEWLFYWSGAEAQLQSGAGRPRHPLALAEPDVTVFRVLLVSAPDMEQEIRAFRRTRASR